MTNETARILNFVDNENDDDDENTLNNGNV